MTQIGFHDQYTKNGGKVEDLKYRVPLYPFVPILCIVMCLSIFAVMAFDPTQRTSLYWGLGFIALCYVYYYFMYTRKKITLPINAENVTPAVRDEI